MATCPGALAPRHAETANGRAVLPPGRDPNDMQQAAAKNGMMQRAADNVQQTKCMRRHAADNVQQTACSRQQQQTTCSRQKSRRQHASDNCMKQHAAETNAGGNVAHAAATKAADDEQRTTCNVQKTASTRQAATGNM
jgi:hypothetical protein